MTARVRTAAGAAVMAGRRVFLVAAVVLGVLIVAGGLIVASGGGGQGQPANRQVAATTPPSSVTPALPAGGWHAVAPSITVPADSPVQQQYDQGFEQGLSSPANRAQFAQLSALELPTAAIGAGWPDLGPASTPEGWTRQFVVGLLDIDFATHSRSALGRWLVAEEAPDLMPGVPVDARLAGLYATVLDPSIIGQASPAPSPAQWAIDATAGVRWSVSNLRVQLDPQWQTMIAAGWQPRDMHASVEDVSGTLMVTQGPSTTTHGFSLVVQLGSARWHQGYGTVLIAGWKET